MLALSSSSKRIVTSICRTSSRHPLRSAALRSAAAAMSASGAAAAGGGDPPPSRSERIRPDQDVDLAAYSERWHKIWESGLEPGQRFDAGAASPALRYVLDGPCPAKGKRVLVPGCGRGYDVVAAAAAGASLAVGLDISPEAVRAAEAARDAGVDGATAARAMFAAADFFAYLPPEGRPFDIGYDYTFLCALPPNHVRRDWAATWARLLAPGGELVTLVFPVDPEADPAVGPPFPVTPELYRGLLLPAGFECIELRQLPPELSHPARRGREWLGRWRRLEDGGGSSAAAASKF